MSNKTKPSTAQVARGATQDQGEKFERHAEQFLLSQGLTLAARNYWCKLGEIDLIMYSGQTLVFVEVRYRRHGYFGGAAASVTLAKQQKLRRAALCYLQAQGLNEAQQPCRFDLIAFEGSELHWLENAF
ncbi:YraN family protein [Oceanisphaera sp. W20_SRM_FM3]|uniref:YraN family protein n=1 Tax=Oceanisphaera sp. W20_SRM_FM3 TaxID=3240267 RepID=UPI003F9BD3FD